MLVVVVGTSEKKEQHRISLSAGETETVALDVDGEAAVDASVFYQGAIVQHRQKGYVSSAAPLSEVTCIEVTRRRIDVVPCN